MIEVVDDDPGWRTEFVKLRERIWPHISHLAVALEHVGSTAVVGLAAKPILDIDIGIRSRAALRRSRRTQMTSTVTRKPRPSSSSQFSQSTHFERRN
jgi:GrpB-like predicted nucleotidyltransferase (UPF0157 family)